MGKQRTATIQQTALKVLEQNPSAPVRHRLLVDVLCRPVSDPDREAARRELDGSRGVQELAREQWDDGGWGAFHSGRAKRKQRILSTEMGIERALALGLDSDHPILQKAASHVIGIMLGQVDFPDYCEKNDRWPTGMRLFLASALSRIDPGHPLLAADRALWCEIAERTFASGCYSEEAEIAAHQELTGVTVKGSYLVLNGKYQLNVLGSALTLPQAVEDALLTWLWTRPDGIGYLTIPLGVLPPDRKPGPFDRWLTSLELLARLFPTWTWFAQGAVEWLWTQRNDDGYWDFGTRARSSCHFPLSDSWRTKQAQVFDWTARILALVQRAYHPDPSAPPK